MALHRLTGLTLGVPDPAAVAAFYREFGLRETAPGTFATVHGGEQLRLLPATRRGLVEVGLGGAAMIAADPRRHVWGLGRHAIGSNFFWYLCDPAGNFAEYASDLDRITDVGAYTPPAWAGPQYVRAWGPPLPPEFLAPKDLPELLA